MRKFTITYRVFSGGNIYKGESFFEAKNAEDAVLALKKKEPSLVSIEEIKEG